MKLFGQHLLENGLVTEAALLAALVQQAEATPSLAQVVYQTRVLTPQDQLAVLSRQARSGCDYRRACEELGLWTAAAAQAVDAKAKAARKPLGQILVERGDLTLANLTVALDTYVKAGGGQAPATAAPRGACEDYARLFDERERDALLAAAPAALAARVAPLLTAARFLGDHAAVALWSALAAPRCDDAASLIAKAWTCRQSLLGKDAA